MPVWPRIEVLELALVERGLFNGFLRPDSYVLYQAVNDTLEFCLIDGAASAEFDVLKIYNYVEFAVNNRRSGLFPFQMLSY